MLTKEYADTLVREIQQIGDAIEKALPEKTTAICQCLALASHLVNTQCHAYQAAGLPVERADAKRLVEQIMKMLNDDMTRKKTEAAKG